MCEFYNFHNDLTVIDVVLIFVTLVLEQSKDLVGTKVSVVVLFFIS